MKLDALGMIDSRRWFGDLSVLDTEEKLNEYGDLLSKTERELERKEDGSSSCLCEHYKTMLMAAVSLNSCAHVLKAICRVDSNFMVKAFYKALDSALDNHFIRDDRWQMIDTFTMYGCWNAVPIRFVESWTSVLSQPSKLKAFDHNMDLPMTTEQVRGLLQLVRLTRKFEAFPVDVLKRAAAALPSMKNIIAAELVSRELNPEKKDKDPVHPDRQVFLLVKALMDGPPPPKPVKEQVKKSGKRERV